MPPELNQIFEMIKHVADLFSDVKDLIEGIQWLALALIFPLVKLLWPKIYIHLIFLPRAVPESSPKIARVYRIISWLAKAHSIYRVITTIIWLLEFLSRLV